MKVSKIREVYKSYVLNYFYNGKISGYSMIIDLRSIFKNLL